MRSDLFDAEQDEPAALGHWVHVYIDRTSRTPVPIPASVRELLGRAERARRRGPPERSSRQAARLSSAAPRDDAATQRGDLPHLRLGPRTRSTAARAGATIAPPAAAP